MTKPVIGLVVPAQDTTFHVKARGGRKRHDVAAATADSVGRKMSRREIVLALVDFDAGNLESAKAHCELAARTIDEVLR